MNTKKTVLNTADNIHIHSKSQAFAYAVHFKDTALQIRAIITDHDVYIRHIF